MITLVKQLAGIVGPLVAALGLLHLIGSDWYDRAVSTATEFVIKVISGA
ncbi:MAG: hypothetical protein OXF41_15610 [bacterium]|nr:hypothetical protein [bacterium]